MAYNMKNSALKMSAKAGSPMQKNFAGSPAKQTKEVPLTIEDRQASMDTIAAERFRTERLYTNRSGDGSMYNTDQYKADEEASERLDMWPRREGQSSGSQKAVKRSQDRLVKGTKKGKTRSKTGKSFDTAFAAANKSGKKTFEFEGKSYSTKTK